MAKVFKFSAAEVKEAVKRIGAGKMTKRQRERWDAMTSEQRLKFAEKVLKDRGSRKADGSIDWEGLMKSVKFLFDLLAPFIIKT